MSARDDLLARYDRMRRADVTGRTVAIDMLNRSLLSDFLPVQARAASGFTSSTASRRCAAR